MHIIFTYNFLKGSEGYKFGFNGQVKDDEIYGEGNTYSAQYWEYDARLGRRWNLDPVDQISISNYACFGNNPILYSDPNGDEFDKKDTRKANRTLMSISRKYERNNNKIDRLQSKGKDVSDLIERRDELMKSMSDINDMKSSPILFKYVKDNDNPMLDFQTDPNIVYIRIARGKGSEIHENRHGGDYARSNNPNYSYPTLKDISQYGYRDEISAWRAQLAYTGKFKYDPYVDYSNSKDWNYYSQNSQYPNVYLMKYKITVTSYSQINKSMLMKRPIPRTTTDLLTQKHVYEMQFTPNSKTQWDEN